MVTLNLTAPGATLFPYTTLFRSSVAEDGTLSFPASDLTGNDSAGPANESGQTLTVATAHVCTAVTDGTGMPASGQNNNTPAAVYNGAASFDYTVHHDGQMPGVNH